MTSEYSYNSWPLGALPKEWQRPEPQQILEMGYVWGDPREIIDIFEKKLADFCGSRYCALTDSATSGIFLSLKYRNLRERISVPKHTYVSVPLQVIHSGNSLAFREEKWSGLYELGNTRIFDSAARFGPNIFLNAPGVLQVLSFQIKKRLPIGRGGAVLTDDRNAYEWLKLASYDGRNLKTDYVSSGHVSQIGWHSYMTPEDAARGIMLMDSLPESFEDTMSWNNYPPLDNYEFFKNLNIPQER